jgi:hypothetical protein
VGSVSVLVGSVLVGLVAVPFDDDPVLVCARTTPAGVRSEPVADPEPAVGSEAFESVVVAVDVDAEPDVVPLVDAAGPVFGSLALDAPSDEAPSDDDVPADDDASAPPESADATPCPVAMADPTPSAIARPPTRPM